MRKTAMTRAWCALVLCVASLLAVGCGGGDPLPEDCVPADFVGPLREGVERCDG